MRPPDQIAAAIEARREDIAWLADDGQTPDAVATRLGVTVPTLEQWCRRHDLALWVQMQGNRERPAVVWSGRLSIGRAS